jgi:glycosyltransferase involved in cell wall biosynthesis
VLVSNRVGGARDVVDASCGRVFPWDDSSAMIAGMKEMLANSDTLRAMGEASGRRAWEFDIARTEAETVAGLQRVSSP